ncbi:hypothetical protein NPIL_291741, partial [Nephila pilipes]
QIFLLTGSKMQDFNDYLNAYVTVTVFYRYPPFDDLRGVTSHPWYDRIRGVRRGLPSALSVLYMIPLEELVIFDFYARNNISLASYEIGDGMVLRLERLGVTIDRRNVF